MKRIAAVASFALALSCGVSSGSDTQVDGNEGSPSTGLTISPIGPGGWQDEKYRLGASTFTFAYSSVQAVCWSDMVLCSDAEEVLCDLEAFGVPGVIDGRDVLVSKSSKTQQCMRRDILARFENSMHDTVTYKRGIRP